MISLDSESRHLSCHKQFIAHVHCLCCSSPNYSLLRINSSNRIMHIIVPLWLFFLALPQSRHFYRPMQQQGIDSSHAESRCSLLLRQKISVPALRSLCIIRHTCTPKPLLLLPSKSFERFHLGHPIPRRIWKSSSIRARN